MKGYPIDVGYMGYLPDIKGYQLFPTEKEYKKYYRENY